MANKFKNFQRKLKVMEMDDIEDLDTKDLIEDRKVSKFHKNDGTEFNKKDKPTLVKPKPFRTFDDGL